MHALHGSPYPPARCPHAANCGSPIYFLPPSPFPQDRLYPQLACSPASPFPSPQARLDLHVMNSFVSLVAATSYYWLWTGYSPIRVDTGNCLYIPQRWLLYLFTAPHIIEIQSKMSDYSQVGGSAFCSRKGGVMSTPYPHLTEYAVSLLTPGPLMYSG